MNFLCDFVFQPRLVLDAFSSSKPAAAVDGQGMYLVEWVYRSIDPGVGLVGQQVQQTALLVHHLKKECQLSFGTYFAVIILFFRISKQKVKTSNIQ